MVPRQWRWPEPVSGGVGGLGPGANATPSGGDLILAIEEGRVSLCSVLHGGELSDGGDTGTGMDRRSRGPLEGPGCGVVPGGSHGGKPGGGPSRRCTIDGDVPSTAA
jgi:hypothetical protein